jgi:hypothetical protein
VCEAIPCIFKRITLENNVEIQTKLDHWEKREKMLRKDSELLPDAQQT